MTSHIITYDYDFSPYGQKVRLLLASSGIPFKRVDQPLVLPRPDLESLGITYRRIPLLAIGKDIYCDSSAIVDVVTNKFSGVPAGLSDKAFEAFGSQTFWSSLSLVPTAALTPEFKKDRATIFPIVTRPDFDTLRPSALGGFKAVLDTIENEFLAHGGPWIGGQQLFLADIHVGWVIRWVMQVWALKRNRASGRKRSPESINAKCGRLSGFPNPRPEVLPADEAAKLILGSPYSVEAVSVASNDPLGIPAGTKVSVESTDSTPGSHPQLGKLVGASRNEIVIVLENGIRLHFPRTGYVVRKA